MGEWSSTSPPSPGPPPPSDACATFARMVGLGGRSIEGYGSVSITSFVCVLGVARTPRSESEYLALRCYQKPVPSWTLITGGGFHLPVSASDFGA
jgi:hypothetical protein